MSELLYLTENQIDSKWDLLQDEVNSYFLNLTENTRIAYKNDLTRFFQFLRLKKIHPFDVQQISIEEFMHYVGILGGRIKDGAGNPAKDRTFNRKLASLKSFYSYLGSKRIISIDPTAFVNFRSVLFSVETNDLSNDSVKKLFGLIPSDNLKHSRDRALLGTFFYTGLRKTEIRKLKFKDYKVYQDRKILRVRTKGGKDRDIALNDELVEMIEHYLLKVKDSGLKLNDESPLFFSIQKFSFSRPLSFLSNSGITLIFMKWVDKLHLGYKVSPHSARATLIGALSDANTPLDENAEYVGHRDPRMTKAYVKRRKSLAQSPVLKISFKSI